MTAKYLTYLVTSLLSRRSSSYIHRLNSRWFQTHSERSMISGKKLINGVELYYECRGKGNHVLLFIPGLLGTTRLDFAPQLDYFGSREGFTVVSFDPRGQGHSRPPRRVFSGTTSFENDAKDAKGLMDALGVKEFSLIGWSSGGIASLYLANLYPDSVKTLTIWGVKTYMAEEDLKFSKIFRHLSNWNQLERQAYEQVYGKELQPLVTEWCDAMDNAEDIGAGLLGTIKCPTLILHGMKDPVVAKFHVDHLEKNIQGSVVYIFKNGKHNIHLRYPEEFNQTVLAFLGKCGTTTPSSIL